MSLNISLPVAAITELESYDWYGTAGIALKDLQTQIKWTSQWVDVSSHVQSISINGSINNLSGEPGANSASVQFDNCDRTFSDLYASSPYSGNLNPGKPVRVLLSVLSSTLTIFQGRVSSRGFVENRLGNEGIASIEIFDDADLMQRRKFDKDYYYQDKKLIDEDDAGNSLLHILLQEHMSILSSEITTNGPVSIQLSYVLFKEGETPWSKIQELSRACLAQYCGFRYDGEFVMESRLVPSWSVPTSECTIVASALNDTVTKGLRPLIANHVKVRGDLLELYEDIVLWELRKVRPVGINSVYPGYCWETVTSGDFYLSDPEADPPQEYWAQYEIDGAEVIHVQSTALSQKIWQGSAYNMTTTGTNLEAESRRGKLVLQNSAVQSINVMNLQIRGDAIVRRTLGKQIEKETALEQILHEQGLSDDDFNWGRVGVASNASSIAAYGQTDLVIDSQYVGNDSQLRSILDWHLQYGKDPKHEFRIDGLPFLAFIQPGAIITLSLSDLGYSALVEVESFSHRITPDGSETSFTLLETPSTWNETIDVTVRQIVAAPAASAGAIGEGETTNAAFDPVDVDTFLTAGTGGEVIIGYIGNGSPDDPNEADRRIYIDDDEITFQIYVNSTWSEVRQIRLGGVDASSNFAPFLSCQGLLGNMDDAPTGDPLPDGTFYHFTFDDTTADQYGVNPWTGTPTYSSTKWEGTKALTSSLLQWTACPWSVGDSFSACFMFRMDSLPTAVSTSAMIFSLGLVNNVFQFLVTKTTRMLSVTIDKGGTTTAFDAEVLSIGTWYCLGFIYNAATNVCYIRVGDSVYLAEPDGTWGSGTPECDLQPWQTWLADDLIFSPTVAVDPEIFLQHVQRNTPWEPLITTKDVIIKAPSGGRVLLQHADDVAGELPHGEPHEHNASIIYEDPATANVIPVDVSGEVPVWATWMEGYFYLRSTTVKDHMDICNSAGTTYYSFAYYLTDGDIPFHFSCPVIDQTIFYKVNQTRVSLAAAVMTRYWG